ncbi:MAG: hypothetical protein HYV07_15440 [Deltaproteobacteria bacterium]|nr:hypothetical protein [Deltaproteobacteria bacterium]
MTLPSDGSSVFVTIERGLDGEALLLDRIVAVSLADGAGLSELEVLGIDEAERIELTAVAYRRSLEELELTPGRLVPGADPERVGDRLDGYRLNRSFISTASLRDGELTPWTTRDSLPKSLEALELTRPDFCDEVEFERTELEASGDSSFAVTSPRGSIIVGQPLKTDPEPEVEPQPEHRVFELRATEIGVEVTRLSYGSHAGGDPVWGGIRLGASEELLIADDVATLHSARLAGDSLLLEARIQPVDETIMFMSAGEISGRTRLVALGRGGRILVSDDFSPWTEASSVQSYVGPPTRYVRGGVAIEPGGDALVVAALSSAIILGRDSVSELEGPRIQPPLESGDGLSAAAYLDGWGTLVGTVLGRVLALDGFELHEIARFERKATINTFARFEDGRVLVGGVDGAMAILEKGDSGATVLRSCLNRGDHTIKFVAPFPDGTWLLAGTRPSRARKQLVTRMILRR